MEFNPKISPLIISNVAFTYTDIYRVLMEYIDNSIDAATLGTNPTINNSIFQNDAEIVISIQGQNHINGVINIKDNCKGITDLKTILENIGNSEKKTRAWTNGNFGFGIYSFMAVCGSLEIKTIIEKINFVQSVSIKRSDFQKDEISDVYFKIRKEYIGKFGEHFTEIILTDFDKDKWNDFNFNFLNLFVSKHFELILKESPITIFLNKNGNYKKCRNFIYSILEGDVFQKEFDIISGKGKNRKIKKASIFLKYTSKKVINRPVAFFSKGRRINDVNNIKLFDTNMRKQIWTNPQLTGYINTGDILIPAITRDFYKNDPETKRLFSSLRKLESEILEFINDCNRKNLTIHFKNIESLINDRIKRSIIKSDKIKRKPQIGDDVTISKKSEGYMMECIEYEKMINKDVINFTRSDKNDNKEVSNKKDTIPATADNYTSVILNVSPVLVDTFSMNIKIEGDAEPLKDNQNDYLLSILNNNDVIIYKKHKTFSERIKRNSLGEFMTTRLINLIIIEFLSHYINISENKNFKEFKELYYLLEKEMIDLDGKPLLSHY